ncbi:helicase-like protein [Senna tora]|uniref:Helicase-like protein n=1 Tax=Senna tora TaxID=362788 RepID=A0A834W5K3_9FABA|nr:helicase-like protein [Senna tora]
MFDTMFDCSINYSMQFIYYNHTDVARARSSNQSSQTPRMSCITNTSHSYAQGMSFNTLSSSNVTDSISNSPPSVFKDISNTIGLTFDQSSSSNAAPSTIAKGRATLSTLFDVNDTRNSIEDLQSNATQTDTDVLESASYTINKEYYDIGRPTYECEFCGALLWFDERVNRSRAPKNLNFSMCCMQGKVKLPPVKRPPHVLDKLLTNKDSRSAHFMKEIRNCNNMFAFTSMGGKTDHSVNKGKGPYVFRIQGQNMHMLGSLIPRDGESPKFAQLYIYDTENEDRVRSSNTNNLRMKLIRKRNSDARTHNLPTASEVAALIVGYFDMSTGARDIIVESKSSTLQHIDELHPLYLPMQYPLLFPYGEDGYRPDTLYRDGSTNEDRK